MRRIVSALAVVLVVGLVVGVGPAQAREAEAPTSGSAGIGDPYFPLDGNGGIDVLHYDVRDRYDFGSGRLQGRTTLTLLATQDLSRFNLDFLLRVTRVRVDGVAASFGRGNRHELRITLPTPVTAGRRLSVEVRYTGRPADATYLGQRNWLADAGEVVTVNEPHMAPWWFPANDHPRDKATMDVRITVPRQRKVISNGSRVDRVVKGALATTHWRSSEPMVPYLAFFAAGDFEVRKGSLDGRPYVVAVSKALPLPGRRAAMKMMLESASLTAWLETQLGPYPFSSTGGVVTSLAPGFALETQTRPVYPAVGPASRRLLVHELAHQWFGDSVSVDRWRDIWLNEGFASFMEARWAEATGGPSAGQWLSNTYDALKDDPVFWQLQIGDPGADRVFDLAVYIRGAMTLQALRNRIGEDAFWTVLRTWLSSRSGGNGRVEDFRALAASVSGQDLGEFFDTWLLSSSRPAKTAANGF
ncbi:M1 family metallopeptidase [Nocardioides dilutus]